MNVTIYTDGACAGNPGVGGYAAILVCNGQERIVRGCMSEIVTNNKMELKAIVEALNWINKVQKAPCELEIHTDSKYIIDCATGKDKDGSKRKIGWFKGRKNEDLWMEFITQTLKGKHKIKFVKVKGHSGDLMNERCDRIAKEECVKAKHKLVWKEIL